MTDRHVGSGQTYPTIQLAVNACINGDTVIVHAGTYKEKIYITTPNITIKNNPGDTPLVTGGADLTTLYPQNSLPNAPFEPPSIKNDQPYLGYSFGNLVWFRANGGVWDGIDIGWSRGRGIFFGDDVALHTNATLKNCTISYCRGTGAMMQGVTNVTYENVIGHHNVYYYYGPGVLEGENHPGAFGVRRCSNITVTDCDFYLNAGETFMIDWNWGGSNDCTITNTKIDDSKRASLYIHGTGDVVIDSCSFGDSVDQDITDPGKTFPTVIRTLEERSWSMRRDYTILGVQDVTFTNCVFANHPLSHLTMDHYGQPGTFGRRIKFLGCTFVQNTAGLWIRLGNERDSSNRFTNVLFEGNIFWTSNPSTKKMWWNAFHSGFTFNYNLFNISLTGINSEYNRGTGNQTGDPAMVSPNAIITMANRLDPANYKIKLGSDAIAMWPTLPTELTDDYFGVTRSATNADVGFNEYNIAPAVGVIPEAGFSIQVDSQEVQEIEPSTEVDLTDTSTPASGKTITGWLWTITLPGTSTGALYTTQNPSHTFTAEGEYHVNLQVTQSDGKVAGATKVIIVKPVIIVGPGPQPPPTGGNCNFGSWTPITHAGNPGYNSSGENLYMTCLAGDKAIYRADWQGQIVVGETISFSANVFANLTSGTCSLVILYYGASGYISGQGHTIEPNIDFTTEALASVVPSGCTAIKAELRMWGGVGTAGFNSPCITSTTNLAAPVAVIEAEVDAAAITDGADITAGDTIDWDGSSSTGVSKTYHWQTWKFIAGSLQTYLDPYTNATPSVQYDEEGFYQMVLRVTQSDGRSSTDIFSFTVGAGPLQVWFEADQVGADIPTGGHISGTAPITVTFSVKTNSPAATISQQVWEILDENEAVIETIERIGALTRTFPLELLDIGTYFYGLKLSITMQDGRYDSYVRYGFIEVYVPPETYIGPSIPETISIQSRNRIRQDGRQEHKLDFTLEGEAGKVVAVDWSKAIVAQVVDIGYSSTGALSGTNTRYGALLDLYQLLLARGILFRNEGLITAQTLSLDARIIIAPQLPTTDPMIPNAWWIDPTDSNRIKGSVAVAPAEGTEDTQDHIYVADGNDDGNENSPAGAIDLTSNAHRLNASNPYIAFRFLGVDVPNGATITGASIDLPINATATTVQMDIDVEDSDDAPALSTTTNDISNRTLTGFPQTHALGSVADGWRNFAIDTDAIQDVVDRASWAPGNDMVVVLTANSGCDVMFNMYNFGASSAAVLHIDYN